jgi:hypothetical protein
MQAIVFLPIGIRVHPWETARNLCSRAQTRESSCNRESRHEWDLQAKRGEMRIADSQYQAARSERVPAPARVVRLMK